MARDDIRLIHRIEVVGECWEYQGHRTKDGYGQLRSNGRVEYAHRIAWRVAHGEIPPGLFVLHRCDNPPCVRPEHLFLGTNADNMADMIAKGRARHRAGEDHQCAKLTEAEVREIRARCAAGETQRAVAIIYGISKPQVGHIVTRRSWAHVS